MGAAYTYSEGGRSLDPAVPLVTRERLLAVCKEVDEDTPEEETASFIMTAHTLLVTALDGYGLPDALMGEIGLYLAAHFAVVSYPAVSREQLAVMSRSFFGRLGLGLDNTRYGQGAMSLDPTGVLRAMSEGKTKPRPGVWNLGNGFAPRRAR